MPLCILNDMCQKYQRLGKSVNIQTNQQLKEKQTRTVAKNSARA